MGQRLNIEILYEDKVLANAYYHWSAYTGSAIELTKEAIDGYCYRDLEDGESKVQFAVAMLEGTGAGIDDEEKCRISKSIDDEIFSLACNSAIDRNRGLISVTKEGISETEKWEEGRVSIRLDSETIGFNVLFDNPIEEIENADSLEYISIDLDDIPFEEFYDFAEIVNDNPNGIIVDNSVIQWIE